MIVPYFIYSKSLLEFLNLIDTVASEISTIPENNSWRYHNILSNITIMYSDTVPFQHCKSIECHPQQSGIHFYNCDFR